MEILRIELLPFWKANTNINVMVWNYRNIDVGRGLQGETKGCEYLLVQLVDIKKAIL